MQATTNQDKAKLVDITTNRVIMVGTVKECRKYKRAHYDRFSVIYCNGQTMRG